MKYYNLRQNNSGGSFIIDNNLSINNIIKAENANSANKIAKFLGAYYNGCNKGIDCHCCGDRWNEIDEWDQIKIYQDNRIFITSSFPSKYEYIIHEISKNIKNDKIDIEKTKYGVLIIYLNKKDGIINDDDIRLLLKIQSISSLFEKNDACRFILDINTIEKY